jgi:hypothetical protein
MTSLLATGLTSVTFGELAVPEEEEDETEEEEDWEQEGRRVSPSLTGNLEKCWPRKKSPNQTTKGKRNWF